MSMFTYDYAQMSRERALNARVADLEEGLDTAQSQLLATQATIPSVPTIGNRVRNGEADFNDNVYISATYTPPDNENRPFGWYEQDSATASNITETIAGTESAKSIKLLKTSSTASISSGGTTLTIAESSFVAGDVGANIVVAGAGASGADLVTTIASFTSATQVGVTAAAGTTVSAAFMATWAAGKFVAWHRGQGNIWMGGSRALFAPIAKTVFYPGKPIFVVGKVKANDSFTVAALDPTWELRLSIWDNTVGQEKIIEGAAFALSGQIISGSGAKTRKYILKVNTTTEVFYFSDVASPLSIGSLPAAIPAGSAGEVVISWPSFTDAESYELYRSDTDGGLSNYYKLIRVTNGDTTFIDQGGRPGSAFDLSVQVNPKAEVFIKNFGQNVLGGFWLQFGGSASKAVKIQMPTKYNYALTTDKQYLRIDVVDTDHNPVTMDALTLLFDQIGCGLTNGSFDYAQEDLQFTANVVVSSPDGSTGGTPSGGGSGGEIGGGGGGYLPY